MRIEIASLHKRIGRTTIYVTHDQVEAMTLADKIVVFNEGGIVQAGSPLELYNHPVNKFVAGFLGSPKMNFIETDIIKTAAGNAGAPLGGGQVALSSIKGTSVGEGVILGLRPEDVQLREPAEGVPSATVLFSEQLGSETFLHCEIQGRQQSEPSRITLKRPGQLQAQAGQRVSLSIAPDRLYCFDAKTEMAFGHG